VGLFHTFITTATAQQAIRWYGQVRFSSEEGVAAFHQELMLWAGRLAQYPDEYSFKRRLFSGLPADYRQHLALYDGVSTENSSINEIMWKAHHLEKIMTSLRVGQGLERLLGQGAVQPAVGGSSQRLKPREWQQEQQSTSIQLQNHESSHVEPSTQCTSS